MSLVNIYHGNKRVPEGVSHLGSGNRSDPEIAAIATQEENHKPKPSLTPLFIELCIGVLTLKLFETQKYCTSARAIK